MTRSPPDLSLADLANLAAEHFSDYRHSDEFNELSLVIDNSDREHPTLIVHIGYQQPIDLIQRVESFLCNHDARTHLLRCIKGSCKLLLCLKACVKSINYLFLVLGTRKDGNCSVLNRDQGLARVVGREVAAGTIDTAGWSVRQEFSCVFGSESTDGGELLKMIVTANEGKCELI